MTLNQPWYRRRDTKNARTSTKMIWIVVPVATMATTTHMCSRPGCVIGKISTGVLVGHAPWKRMPMLQGSEEIKLADGWLVLHHFSSWLQQCMHQQGCPSGCLHHEERCTWPWQQWLTLPKQLVILTLGHSVKYFPSQVVLSKLLN